MSAIILNDTNYSGYSADITFSAYTGGSTFLGTHIIPYTFTLDYYYGTYTLYYSQFNKTCTYVEPPILNNNFTVKFNPNGVDSTSWFIDVLNYNGILNMTVDWGDGQTSGYTGNYAYSPTHTYATAGSYDATITIDKPYIYELNLSNNFVSHINLSGLSIVEKYSLSLGHNIIEDINNINVGGQWQGIALNNNLLTSYNLDQLGAVESLSLNNNQISSFTCTIGGTGLLNLRNNQLTTFDIVIPSILYDLDLNNNLLTQYSVNNLLINLSENTPQIYGSLNLSNQTPPACPTGDGIIAQNHLVNDLGWSVAVDSGCPNPFISTWRTTTSNETIVLPLSNYGNYNFTVNWGDGNIETITSYHEYAVTGDYTVTITGTIEGWSFYDEGIDEYFGTPTNIINVLQWGCLNIGNRGGGFFGTNNLTLDSVSDILNLQGVTNLDEMFEGSSITTVNRINEWDVSGVNGMRYMFAGAIAFNQPLNNWNVSGVTDMAHMFVGATNFNQPLNNWNVSGVTDMTYMFAGTRFNQNISNWDVSNVQSMFGMFRNTPFNQDISNWDVSNVQYMSSMFNGVTGFTGNLSSWITNSLIDISNMFENAILFNSDLSNWNVSGITSMRYVFQNATSFNGDISSWKVSNVQDMQGMFYSATSFNIDISSWDVSSVPEALGMFFMFQYAETFNQDLSSWCVTNIPSPPPYFDTGASSWVLPKPVWGTCPP